MTELILPANFEFGVATSAFQIEGGWNADDKSPSIWDTFSQTVGNVYRDQTGNIACDHYHRYAEDIALMKELGLDRYRLSLSWSRIVPDGIGKPSQAGLDFYKRLLDEVNDAGIRPNVTLYHWDLPQALEDRGGWPNRDVTDWFAEYAAIAFTALGDRVPTWATVNEPISLWVGYGLGWFAPGRRNEREGRQAMHNALLAHGKAVQAFRQIGTPDSEIGIVLDVWKRHPLTASREDHDLAEQGDDDGFRFFLGPILTGGYSARLTDRLMREETFPRVEDGDFETISARLDYLGLNVYSRVVVDSTKQAVGGWAQSDPEPGGNFLDDGSEFYPKAVYDALMMVKDDYGWTGPVYIAENGVADPPENEKHDPAHDTERIRYVDGFLTWISRAIQDGADVRGYYLWSLLDNYEWSAGFSKKFGLYRVDPTTLDRLPKDSAGWYRDTIARHKKRIAGL